MKANLFEPNNFHVSFADIQINGPFRRCRHISPFFLRISYGNIAHTTSEMMKEQTNIHTQEWKEKIKFNSEYHTNRELSKCQFSRNAPNYDSRRSILQSQLFFDFISNLLTTTVMLITKEIVSWCWMHIAMQQSSSHWIMTTEIQSVV